MKKVTLTLTNCSKIKKLFILEPYAEEYVFSPNQIIEVIFDADVENNISIDVLNNTIIINAGASIYCDGVELEPEFGVLLCE